MEKKRIENQNREYYWNTYSIFKEKWIVAAHVMIFLMFIVSVGIHSLNLLHLNIREARRQNLENEEVFDYAIRIFKQEFWVSILVIGLIAAALWIFVIVMYLKKSYKIYQCKKVVFLIPVGICVLGVTGEILFYTLYRQTTFDIWLALRVMMELAAFLPTVFGSRVLLPLELRKPVEVALKLLDLISEWTMKKLK